MQVLLSNLRWTVVSEQWSLKAGGPLIQVVSNTGGLKMVWIAGEKKSRVTKLYTMKFTPKTAALL